MDKNIVESEKHTLENGEIIKKAKKKGFGYYFGWSFLVLMVLGIATIVVLAINSPATEVISGKQMNKKHIEFLKKQGLVDANEVIQFWYSDGFGDFRKGFYLFTNKKVILYSKNWKKPALIIPFSEIVDIELEHVPSFYEDSQITIYLNDDSSVLIPVSSAHGGDIKYHERLVSIWQEHQGIDE